MTTPTRDQLAQFTRTLGHELRTARKQRGWTRKQLRAHLTADSVTNAGTEADQPSLQTLATYELGTRRITVERFVQLCAVLGQPPDQLLLNAMTRVFGSRNSDPVRVDLSTLARTADPRLVRLRRWAAVRVRQRPAELPTIQELDEHALTALAELAGTTSNELAYAFRDLASASST